MNVYDIVDVTDIEQNGKVYNGAESKYGITIDGVDFIVKKQRSFWNNVICEYVASNVILILGGDAHRTYLGRCDKDSVVLCRDFTSNKERLKSFRSVESLSLDTELDKHDYYYNDVIYLFNKLHQCNVKDCITKFNAMYVYDALLGNPDRHRGNWGVLKSNEGYRFAPIFDNGAALFPRAVDATLTEDWMRERIYTFPNSKIMFNDKRERSSYYNVLKDNEIFCDIVSAITDDKIYNAFAFIETAPISDYLKTLYKTVIWYRYKCLLKREDFVWKGIK